MQTYKTKFKKRDTHVESTFVLHFY